MSNSRSAVARLPFFSGSLSASIDPEHIMGVAEHDDL